MRKAPIDRLMKIATLLKKVSVVATADVNVPMRPVLFLDHITSVEKHIEDLVLDMKSVADMAKSLDAMHAQEIAESLGKFSHELEYNDIIPKIKNQIAKLRQK